MEYIKDQLVDENLEEKMVAVAQRGDIAAIRWQSQTRNGEPYWLRTPLRRGRNLVRFSGLLEGAA
jgi:hypothetical protein